MQGKELHNFLFQLFDYAESLADQIRPGNYDNANYFLTLVFIEQIMDKYGRGLISQSAKDANDPALDQSASLSEAHRRLDFLRSRIQSLIQEYNFNEELESASQQMVQEWKSSLSN